MIEIAQTNSARLLRLINDFLDIEKIEAGKLGFVLQPLKIMPLVEQAIAANRAYAEQFGVTFALEGVVPGLVILTDSDRLMQVLNNLLANAAKFSPPGGMVLVAVSHREDVLRIAVTDHGPGIPVEFRSRIFKSSPRPDSSDTRQKGGTGLGLSIAKAIVERLGGQIGYETEIDVGSTFYIDLPLLERNELWVRGDTYQIPAILASRRFASPAAASAFHCIVVGLSLLWAKNRHRKKALPLCRRRTSSFAHEALFCFILPLYSSFSPRQLPNL